jgi:hypothetical protein
MKTCLLTWAAALATPLALAQSATADTPQKGLGAPIAIGDGWTFDPIIDARLRYENVDTPTVDANAVTLRLRAGFEIGQKQGFSFLAEGEATLGIDNDYNAFPGTFAPASIGFSKQRRPQYANVSDPQNVEVNRLQLAYRIKQGSLTVGRQRINLDDQRFVGSVGWRQNEQTFDAVRGVANLGPVNLDATYSISQRTVFGIDAGQRQAYGGKFWFLGAGVKLGPVNVKGFGYLLSYDEPIFTLNSSQTYGARATAAFKLAPKIKLALAGSYARQSDYGTNPLSYKADYIAGEANLGFAGLSVTGGYEKLGGDAGARHAFQTPMATLHKFNGWADLFLVTPQTATYGGLQDYYGGAAYVFTAIKALPGLNAAVTYHRFDSDYGNVRYGEEWDASVGVKVRRVTLLAKYADYNAKGFAVDTKKFWLQAEVSY